MKNFGEGQFDNPADSGGGFESRPEPLTWSRPISERRVCDCGKPAIFTAGMCLRCGQYFCSVGHHVSHLCHDLR